MVKAVEGFVVGNGSGELGIGPLGESSESMSG